MHRKDKDFSKKYTPMPYTDLIEDVVKAEDIRHVLTLQCSLHDNLHHPRHACSTCTTTIDAFTALKDLALKN